MSYDLYVLRKDDVGDDPSGPYERLEEQEEREPTPDEVRQLRQLAGELQAANPGVDLVESDKGLFLQLGYEGERPVVIDIGPEEMTMSWSYGADDAEAALAEVRLYLPVFERHGYVAFDPQLERLFDVDRDAEKAGEIHRDVHRSMQETSGSQPSESRPWWKRFFG